MIKKAYIMIYDLVTGTLQRVLGIILYHVLRTFESGLFPSPRPGCMQTPQGRFFKGTKQETDAGPDRCCVPHPQRSYRHPVQDTRASVGLRG